MKIDVLAVWISCARYELMKEGWYFVSVLMKVMWWCDGLLVLLLDFVKKYWVKVVYMVVVLVGKFVCVRSSSMRLMSVVACASVVFVFFEMCLLRMLLMKFLVGKEFRGMEFMMFVIFGFFSMCCGSAEKSEMSVLSTSYALLSMVFSFIEFVWLVWNVLVIFVSIFCVWIFLKGMWKSFGVVFIFLCRKFTRFVTICGTFGGIVDVGRFLKGVLNVYGWYVFWIEMKKFFLFLSLMIKIVLICFGLVFTCMSESSSYFVSELWLNVFGFDFCLFWMYVVMFRMIFLFGNKLLFIG